MRYLLLLTFAVLLISCEEMKEVVATLRVEFAQPFPASGRDLPALARRHQGRYYAVGDTLNQLEASSGAICGLQWSRQALSKREFAELGADDRSYRVLCQQADSVWLLHCSIDTLFAPGEQHMRRYAGAYYLSSGTDSSWFVLRLVPDGNRLRLDFVNYDTLKYLHQQLPGVIIPVGTEEEQGWLLRPRTRWEVRQVACRPGLWKETGCYERR